jgi:hypothetical protein
MPTIIFPPNQQFMAVKIHGHILRARRIFVVDKSPFNEPVKHIIVLATNHNLVNAINADCRRSWQNIKMSRVLVIAADT